MLIRIAHCCWSVLVASITISIFSGDALAIPAFPGAEGFGANSTGGRGGEVFHVDSLAGTSTGTYQGFDGYNHGTLRWCLTYDNSTQPRTIVFDIGGTVPLASQITIENSKMTVAGQTAPGMGLTSSGRPWLLESGDNLVIRYVRNRLGKAGGQDSMGVEGGTNIVFDHVSSTWSNDELLSVAKDGNLVTVQNSFIYEALDNNQHHAYGSLIRPDIDSKVTYHHNLYGDNQSRNPRPGTYNNRLLEFDFRNNVVYNWGLSAGYSGGSEGSTPEPVHMNYVGNYVISGPSTYDHQNLVFHTEQNASMTAYQSGNLIDSDNDLDRDGVDNGWGAFDVEAGTLTHKDDGPFAFSGVPVTTQSAADAYESVLKYGGSFWWNRDSADTRAVTQVRTQTGAIIDHESDVGGLPTLVGGDLRDASWDTDHDGMPNAWETAHGLNPASSPDRNADFDTDGYTNLEEYINEVGAWPAPQPISWTGGTGRYALNQNWNTWQPSRFDEVRINSGTATVDAIGQHARIVRIGTNPSDNGTLSVTGGWLIAAEEVVIGANAAATATLSLSGGTLDTPKLNKGAGGTFNFTGGTLHADEVGFSLVNNGGKLAPGTSTGSVQASPGITKVTGDLTLASGVLEIEIGGTAVGQFDRLEVTGVTHLGGTLSVKLVDLGGGVFVPQLGNSFGFLASQLGTDGMFANFALPALAPGLTWQLNPGNVTNFLTVVAANPLDGDFNGDGKVDTADYVVWRNTDGTQPEYDKWRANFGRTAGSANGTSATVVPEPLSLALLALAVHAKLLQRARRSFGVKYGA